MTGSSASSTASYTRSSSSCALANSSLDTYRSCALWCLVDEQFGHMFEFDRIPDVVEPVRDGCATHAEVIV